MSGPRWDEHNEDARCENAMFLEDSGLHPETVAARLGMRIEAYKQMKNRAIRAGKWRTRYRHDHEPSSG